MQICKSLSHGRLDEMLQWREKFLVLQYAVGISLSAGIIQRLFKKFFGIELKINLSYSFGAGDVLRTDGRTRSSH